MPARAAPKPRSTDDRPSARGLATVIQAKAGAGVNPVPAFRFLARAAQDGALRRVSFCRQTGQRGGVASALACAPRCVAYGAGCGHLARPDLRDGRGFDRWPA
jgi:hypothetical protein